MARDDGELQRSAQRRESGVVGADGRGAAHEPRRVVAKLEREALHQLRRVDASERAEERRKWKLISKSVGQHMDAKYGREGR